MRTFYALIICLTLGFIPTLSGQVTEVSHPMSIGDQNAMVIELAEGTHEIFEQHWKRYSKDYGKVRKVKGTDELKIEFAQIEDVAGTDPINVYVRHLFVDSVEHMYMWVEKADGFVSSADHPDAYEGCESILEDFAYQAEVELISEELRDQEKILTRLESDLGRLQRQNESYHKTILKSKTQISEAEMNIETNAKDTELATEHLERQREMTGVDPKEQKKAVSKAEKEVKRLENNLANYEKSIVRANEAIDGS